MPMRNTRVSTALTWLSMPSEMLLIASFSRYVSRPRQRPHAASIPINRKKTGVARTITWLGDSFMSRLSRGSGHRTTGIDPDDLVHAPVRQAARHADDVVVQVDGGIAVAGNEQHGVIE